MQPEPLQLRSLSHFEISGEHRFLPDPDPLSSCFLCPHLHIGGTYALFKGTGLAAESKPGQTHCVIYSEEL